MKAELTRLTIAMNIIDVVKESWGWTGLEPEAIVGENDFGNLIIRDIHGKYWRLCPEDVYCKTIANNRSDLDVLSHDQTFLADWYMTDLVNQALEKLGPLQSGRKYHLAIPGVLGGAYSADNFRQVTHADQIRFAGDIGRQIETLPDGAQIRLRIIE